MRIVHICLLAPYNDYWGYQDNLLPKYHRKSGHSVTVITTDSVHKNDKIETVPAADYRLDDGQHIIRLSSKKYFPHFISDIIRYYSIYDILEKESPDFIMIHGLNGISALQAVKYRKNHNNCHIVADNHMDYHNSPLRQKPLSVILRLFYKFINLYCQKYYDSVFGVTPERIEYQENVFGISHRKSSLLVMGGDDEKIHFNEMPQLRNDIRKELELGNDDFVIVTGGKIDRSKNIHLLMQAVSELNGKVKLIVFGQPNDEMKNEIAGLSDNVNIRFLGWIPSDKAYNYFLAADLAVFPGTHSVLWEQACACGIPCVFKNWDGMHHIDVGGNCKFLYKDSTEEIKSVLFEIADNKAEYLEMKNVAEKEKNSFFYSKIAKVAIGDLNEYKRN